MAYNVRKFLTRGHINNLRLGFFTLFLGEGENGQVVGEREGTWGLEWKGERRGVEQGIGRQAIYCRTTDFLRTSSPTKDIWKALYSGCCLLLYAETLKTRTNMSQTRPPFSMEETGGTDNTDDTVDTVDTDDTDGTDDTDVTGDSADKEYLDNTDDTNDTFGIILGYVWDTFGILFGYFWDTFGYYLDTFWNFMGYFSDTFEIPLGGLLVHFGILFEYLFIAFWILYSTFSTLL